MLNQTSLLSCTSSSLRTLSRKSQQKNRVSQRKYFDMSSVPSALTFDDVLLEPRLSTVSSRRDITLKTRLTKNITLNSPFVSSNMDTVTESAMAIAMAREGSIGILHRYLSVDEQVSMVKKVKRSESLVISDPYCCEAHTTVSELREIIAKNGVDSLLVTNKNNELIGIVTRRDLLWAKEEQLVSDIMTERSKLVVGNENTSIEEAEDIIARNRKEKLPLVDASNKVVGLITSTDLLNQRNRSHASLDEKKQLMVGAAVGVKTGYLERAEALIDAGCDVLVVDIAHGHSTLAIETTKNLKKHFPEVDVIAGNVASSDGAQALIEAGADAIKVGVGPGSICITRIVTGCGVPQLHAISECARIGAQYDVPILADGGIKNSGDIVKALAAGAETVMMGNVLAGTDESPGQTLIKDGKKVKIVRGMAGYGANLSDRQRREMRDDIFDVVPEGVEAMVPYRGAVSGILQQLRGGVRSGISYCGGKNIREMQQNAKFVKISGAGKQESGSHDVKLI
eukprot:TRINITY_DN7943_c0_g1_i1.p1 TRINITY_DN7943_c0_g1~~TRINITY_DN7943_c0_g1_i1.p1  ORF type:complete len:511 (-),score=159.49 TRINITY_DN7943_c0_g1_i1:11-1543(-)